LGKRYGDFTIIEEDEGGGRDRFATAICSQGHMIHRRLYDLKKKNRVPSCKECYNQAVTDEVIGRKYGDYTVNCLASSQDFTVRPSWWKFVCTCDCGDARTIRKCDLRKRTRNKHRRCRLKK
jgi:hypothetical protein